MVKTGKQAAQDGRLPVLLHLNVGVLAGVELNELMHLTNAVVTAHPGITTAVAARVAKAVQRTASIVLLRSGENTANAGNIFSVLALSAAVGTNIQVQACGEDEAAAANTVQQILSQPCGDLAA